MSTAYRPWLMLVAVVAAATCGGGGGAPTAPTPSGGGGTGAAAPTSATIVIGPAGVSPSGVTIARGGRVTFVNNGQRLHEISSDAHPAHTDCPEINLLGTLAPGQTGMTGVMNTVRTCGFHDHLNPTEAGLRGSIVVQ